MIPIITAGDHDDRLPQAHPATGRRLIVHGLLDATAPDYWRRLAELDDDPDDDLATQDVGRVQLLDACGP